MHTFVFAAEPCQGLRAFTEAKQVKSGRQPHGLPNFANPPNRTWYIPDLAQWSGMSYWLAELTSSPSDAMKLRANPAEPSTTEI